ncbi:transcription termination/antitermination protein NusG [Defluviitalea phaphyphila]|uniref:transcription termination/antitermination protein NusG n=1 Tax=Defluviitalea phaphyphila TaxID=1473580 RepID=UPI0007317505|nr:transcription termination/antitermination protein NusG [Defluviitalea phaphyphila]
MADEAKWYVVHTYSGYENKVKANIEKVIGNRNMHELIQEVVVPIQETVEIKNGKKRMVQRKVFPGYVLVKMIMTDDTWYIVRNTRGVTGFVGPGSKPVPLSEEEIKNMGIELPKAKIDLEVEDAVKVITGPFENSIGVITEINEHKRTVIVKLSMFGRETPVELDFTQIQKI